MKRILLSAVLASASTAVFSSVAALPPAYRAYLPAEQHQGDVSYISGGLSRQQADSIKRASQDYPLELIFRQDVNGKPKDLYDVPLQIRNDATGKVVFDGRSAGPYFIARVPKGRYTVTAHWDNWNFSKDLAIGDARDRVIFAWKRDTPSNVG
ncbi:MAG TPA: hypothetical protein VH040_07485 [Usitatibacter sp.]|jgi:hypothetical protein|nr:hypothetical protein [Usitatibacter sp.]